MMANKLTPKENIVAGLSVMGYSQKEIADKLNRSHQTIANQHRSIHEKLQINKSTELSKWWFCSMFEISEEQLKEKLLSIGALTIVLFFGIHVVMIPNEILQNRHRIRCRRPQVDLVAKAQSIL